MAIARSRGMTTDQKATLAGAIQSSQFNQPGGPPQLDENGELPIDGIRIRTGTEAELASIVLAQGELAYSTDTRRLFAGDAATAGGLVPGFDWNSAKCVYVNPTGTGAQNAAAVIAAYAKAKTLSPGQYAEVWVVLGNGLYDFTGLLNTFVMDTAFINLIGMGGALILAQTFDGTNPVITWNNVESRIERLTITATLCPGIKIVPGSNLRRLADVTFAGITSASVGFTTTGTVNNLQVTRCTSNVTLCGGVDAIVGGSGCTFDTCVGGASSFMGGATATGGGTFSGLITNCRQTGSNWYLNLAGTVAGTLTKGPITKLSAGARIYNSIFSNASGSAAALQNNSVAVAIKAHGNACSAALLGTSVTQSVAGSTNWENAGVNLW